MTSSTTRAAFATILSMAAAVFCPTALAQEYPAKPVKIVFPYPPGGQPDIVLRLVAPQFREPFGQPYQLGHLPGSDGVVAASPFLRQPADGYTIAYADGGTWAIYHAMNPKVDYAPVRD